MKEFFKKIWNAVKNTFQKADDTAKKMVPVAINIVEGLKDVMDTGADDILLEIAKKAIPGEADDILIDKIHQVVEQYIPVVLLDLHLIDDAANAPTVNDKLKIILERLKLSNDATKNILYHGLCSLILEKLSDGKFNWSDAVAVSEYYFKNIKNGTTAAT